MGIYEQAMAVIDEACENAESIGKLATWSGVKKYSLIKWHNRECTPSLKDLAKFLDSMGYRLVRTDEEYCVDESHNDDFIAVPVIRDPAILDPGFVPPHNIRGWCHVEKNYESVSGRSDLVVIQIEDDMMAPLIPRGSQVLVDRSDVGEDSNCIYLVRLPHKQDTAIRRVFINDDEPNREIIFANDNPQYKKPKIFRLKRDYHGDMSRALLGRAIWLRKPVPKG